MGRFRPQVHYTTKESQRVYYNGGTKSMTIVVTFKTYRELIKKLPVILEDSIDVYVSVYRSKRAQFGEWYEHWQLDVNGKPVIIKQGWS